MRTKRLPIIIVSVLLTAAITSHSDDSNTKGANLAPSPQDQLVKFLQQENQSLSRVLFELAAERFALNESRKEVWIFTIHNGREVKKFSDKKYTVVSLPVMQEDNRKAVCQYAGHYNSFNIKAADLNVKAGKYREAREVLQLIRRFDCSGIDNDSIAQRLLYLERLERSENIDATLKKYMEMYVDHGPHWKLSDIETTPASVVDNLYRVRLP